MQKRPKHTNTHFRNGYFCDHPLPETLDIDRRKIQIQEPIKKAGEYSIPVKLHPEVTAQIKLTVEGDKVIEKTETEEKPETPEATEAEKPQEKE